MDIGSAARSRCINGIDSGTGNLVIILRYFVDTYGTCRGSNEKISESIIQKFTIFPNKEIENHARKKNASKTSFITLQLIKESSQSLRTILQLRLDYKNC
jgi:hypothetical protein